MSEQSKILARIQEGLKSPAPLPGSEDTAIPPTNPLPSLGALRAWLPPVGATFDERLALFSRNAADLKAEFHLANSWVDVSAKLLRLRELEGWKRVGSHAGELTDLACRTLELPVCRTDQSYLTSDLETCDVGLTECDALIAQTGSVLLTSRSAGGRALSVLPPHHIVLVRREQLIPDLSEAFALLKKKYNGDYPSFISFITGPSRTGDIERVLVLGAHGPRKLTIFCF
jgi:L-lactate dehydrogenase complex protein LldG